MDEYIKLMDFSIRSLRKWRPRQALGSKGRQEVKREYKNTDRMSEAMKGVRDLIAGGNQMKIDDILKGLIKNRMLSIEKIYPA